MYIANPRAQLNIFLSVIIILREEILRNLIKSQNQEGRKRRQGQRTNNMHGNQLQMVYITPAISIITLNVHSLIPQFKSIISWALSFLYTPTLTSIHNYWKNHRFDQTTFVGKVISLLFNMLSRLVITFLPRSKCLLISWLQSPSAGNLEPKKESLSLFPLFPHLFAMK